MIFLKLSANVDSYWENHFRFDEATGLVSAEMSVDLKAKIVINAIVPLLFAYGLHHRDDAYLEQAQELLLKLPAEENRILGEWKKLGVKASHAHDSQALVHQFNHMCAGKKCLNCLLGKRILMHTCSYDSENS